MQDAQRDQNRVTVALGASVSDGTTRELLVDPTNDRLLITIIPCADEALVPGVYTNIANRDENHVHADLAVTNDSNKDVRSLITPADPTAQYLYCDVLVE